MMTRDFLLPDLAATARLAAKLGLMLKSGDFVALHGDLGAGKTAFARALIQSLNPAEDEVPSPTFTLVQTYNVPQGALAHCDLYRLGSPEEVYALDWDGLRSGIMLVEWPERLGSLLPAARIDVTLQQGEQENARLAKVSGDERIQLLSGD